MRRQAKAKRGLVVINNLAKYVFVDQGVRQSWQLLLLLLLFFAWACRNFSRAYGQDPVTLSVCMYVCLYVQPSFCMGQVIIIIIFFCKCGLIEKFAIRNSRLVRRVAFCFDFFAFILCFIPHLLQYHL